MMKVLVALTALLLVLGTPAQAGHNLTLANALGGSSPQQIAAEAFVAEIEQRLPGRFKIDTKSGTAMGGEADIWEALQLGALDLAIITTASIVPTVPQLGVLDIPFLFRDAAHAAKVLDGPIGHELTGKINGKGGVFLGYVDRGFRHLTNAKRPVVKPEDLAGLKIRVIPNPIYEMAFNKLGALALPIPVPELYGALRDSRADGQENPLMVIEARRLDQVQKFLSLTGHSYSPAVILISNDTYKSLKPQERAVFAAAAAAAAGASRRAVLEREKPILAALRQKGMTVTEQVDRNAFISALATLAPEWEKRFGADLLARIRDTK